MLSFRVSRIVATLFHRAVFLFLADIFAGHQWFLINNFTGLIDVLFSTDYDHLFSQQDLRFTLYGLGFVTMWWMVHFLSTRQLWFNGVFVELFVLVQLLGYLSSLANSTTSHYQPLLIDVALHFLLISYRSYMAQLRHLDPETSFYRWKQLRKPFVPNRGLQLIQLTPIMYTALHKLKGVLADSTHDKLRYSVGMADAIVYVGINLDLALVALTRLVGTLREAYRDFSFSFAWMFRVNITGSYTVLIRDIGWRSIPSDQLHMSWFIYWIMKLSSVAILWTQLAVPKPCFVAYVCQELSGSFVAATATVYFACLITGTLLTILASLVTNSADVVPRSNVVHNCFDTVQHIRWNSFPWKTDPPNRVYILAYAVLFGHIPLRGKMIQNVGKVVRRNCLSSGHKWSRTIGGMVTIVGFTLYSFAVFQIMNIAVPHVSKCFAKQVAQQSFIWITYNAITAAVEVITIFVHHGLVSVISRRQLEKGAGAVQTFLTAVLAALLTAVNLMGLSDSISARCMACGYRDVAHNLVQIAARGAFLCIALQGRTPRQTLKQIRDVESITYRKKSQGDLLFRDTHQDPCGLCYQAGNRRALMTLDACGHTFHEKCFSSWKSFGHRCPVCRMVFRRSAGEVVDMSFDGDDELEQTPESASDTDSDDT